MIFPNKQTECIEITKKIRKLDKQPFEKGKCNLYKKGCILSYELGELVNFLTFYQVSKEPGKTPPSDSIMKARENLGKMGMADLLIQLRFLCLEFGWSFDDIQKQGLNHRIERQKEIEKSF